MRTPHPILGLALALVLALAACDTTVGAPPPQPDPEPAAVQVAPRVLHPGELVRVTVHDLDLGTIVEVWLAGAPLDPSEVEALADGVRFAMPDPPRNGALELVTDDGLVHDAGEVHAFGLLHVEPPRVEAEPYEHPLAEPFVVLLLNSDGRPIPNVPVRFSATNARFDALDERSRDHATTDARGRAFAFPSVPRAPDWRYPRVDVTLRARVADRFEASAYYRSDRSHEYLEGYPVVLRDDAGAPYAGWLRLREDDGRLLARFDTVNAPPRFITTDIHSLLPVPAGVLAPTSASAADPQIPAAAGVLARLHDRSDSGALARDFDLEFVRFVGDERTLLLRDARTPERDASALARALALDPRVESAEPNALLRPLAHYPPTNFLDQEHHLFHTGAAATWALSDHADGAGVTVAVIDSGFVLDLRDFEGATILEGADFCPEFGDTGCVGFDRDPTAYDTSNSHGTIVLASILAQRNEIATTGVAPRVRALPIKIAPDVTIAFMGLAEIIDGVLWAAGEALPGIPVNPNPADVVNLSLAGYHDSPIMRAAVERLDELGIVVVAAAGNDGYEHLAYPAAYPSVIAVAAGQRAAPTERTEWSNHGAGLDLLAPGEEILSGCFGNLNGVSPDQFCGASGTSLASPIVAGAAALLLAQDPSRTPAEVREVLRASAYHDPSMSAFETGAGLLRIDGALGQLAPTGEHDRTLTLELGDAERSVVLTTDQLFGVGDEVDASALLAAGHVTLRIAHDERPFRADFPLPLALVRQPPERP